MISKLKKRLLLATFTIITASNFALQITAMQEDEILARMLTDEEFYTISGGYTILHDAVLDQDIKKVEQILLDKRADELFINCKNKFSCKTALHLAAETQNNIIYQLLVEADADASIIDFYGKTAVSYFQEKPRRRTI